MEQVTTIGLGIEKHVFSGAWSGCCRALPFHQTNKILDETMRFLIRYKLTPLGRRTEPHASEWSAPVEHWG